VGGLVATLLLASGCDPSCASTCDKLLSCEEVSTARLAANDCEAACLVQEKLYEDWDDIELRASFADLKTCIADEACGDLVDGACYDDELYPF
jgi:hypothetical protein